MLSNTIPGAGFAIRQVADVPYAGPCCQRHTHFSLEPSSFLVASENSPAIG
jgi:hypothetical protein